MATNYRGKLEAFFGSWGSGLGFLMIDGRPIPCENGPTVRALEACFGSVIESGHRVSNQPFKGKEVIYSVDDSGLLVGFTPIEDWQGSEISEGVVNED